MRRVVALTGSIVFLDAMLFGAIIPLLPSFADDYDLTKLEVGLLLGAYGGGALLGGIPGGLLVGRIGPKRGVLAGLAVLALASLGFALAGGAVALGVARFVQGFSSATTWAGALAWVSVSVPRERRGQALGTVFGLAVFGFVVGPLFGGIAELVGIRPAFAGISLVAVGLAAIVATARPPGSEVQRPGAVARALRDRAFVGGLWLNTLPALFFGALDVLVPLRLDGAGYGALAIAAVFVTAGLVEVAVNPLVGRLSDVHGRLLPIRIFLAASVVVTVVIAFATEPLLVAALVVAASISFGGFYTPGMALVADRAEGAGLAQAIGFGVMNSAWAAGALTGPTLGGALAQTFGDAIPYLACGVLCVLTLLAVTRRARRLVSA
ncbi:MAG: MFS transporter [Actinobacteria bacterium]|nr:MFS transporter [Actinomycetota bacterium]